MGVVLCGMTRISDGNYGCEEKRPWARKELLTAEALGIAALIFPAGILKLKNAFIF